MLFRSTAGLFTSDAAVVVVTGGGTGTETDAGLFGDVLIAKKFTFGVSSRRSSKE